jgi:hypothetical protein
MDVAGSRPEQRRRRSVADEVAAAVAGVGLHEGDAPADAPRAAVDVEHALARARSAFRKLTLISIDEKPTPAGAAHACASTFWNRTWPRATSLSSLGRRISTCQSCWVRPWYYTLRTRSRPSFETAVAETDARASPPLRRRANGAEATGLRRLRRSNPRARAPGSSVRRRRRRMIDPFLIPPIKR